MILKTSDNRHFYGLFLENVYERVRHMQQWNSKTLNRGCICHEHSVTSSNGVEKTLDADPFKIRDFVCVVLPPGPFGVGIMTFYG